MLYNGNNKILKSYSELGNTLSQLTTMIDVINIDVDTALKTGSKIEDENRRLRFYGMQYLELVEDLKKAGIINN